MGLNIAMLSIHSSPIGDLGTQNTGGMSVYVRETAKELGKMGHHVDVFTQHHAGNHESVFYLYENVRLIRLSGGTRQNITKSDLHNVLPKLSGELELFRIKENMTYDIVHSHYWISGVLGLMLNSSWNAFHVITYHTLGAVKNVSCPMENASELRLADEKKLAKHCDRIIVPTEKDKDYLIQYYNAPGDNIRIVPCGVNLERFKPRDKNSARRQLTLPVNDPMILYVGRFAPIKGLNRLLKSFSLTTRPSRSVLVMVGGDGEHSFMAQQLKNKAMALHIQDRLIFAGRVDQEILPLYYNAADVLVVPSYYESFGLVALEALACGTPVVTAAVGAMKQIVKDGVTGYVVSDSDPRHFSDGIEAVLEKQNRFSSSKIRASVSEFTWARSASLLLDAYRSVSANKERCNSTCQTNTK
ncbi:MAG: glycosyltransferase [Desulfobacterales bacterium]|jgi:D-inositol-3-phosphate glycosyltransferase|nr:glycosyltransferase [Desulfobacterales bacterium]